MRKPKTEFQLSLNLPKAEKGKEKVGKSAMVHSLEERRILNKNREAAGYFREILKLVKGL